LTELSACSTARDWWCLSFSFFTFAADGAAPAVHSFPTRRSSDLPRNGTSITLSAIDVARGASISRTTVVKAAPALNLQLSSEQGDRASARLYSSPLATAYPGVCSLTGTTLQASVSKNGSVVSANT